MKLARSLAAAALLLLSLTGTPVLAYADDTDTSSSATTDSEPEVTEAQCYEVMDQDGNVLASKNATDHMAPASITKIMTAMVALDAGIDMDDTCTITDMDYEDGAQLAGYTSSDTPTYRELMMAMLVYSANDAAENIAINVAGSEDAFVELMNKKAEELGMTNTQFSNPHGLEEDDHYSCAHDLTVMGRYALENYPFIAQAVMTRQVTVTVDGTETTLESTGELMDQYAGLCGIKTGAVASGTAFLGSSKRYGTQIYTCVLGCSTHEGRFTDTAALMDWVYDEYLKRLELTRKSWPIRLVSSSTSFYGKRVVTAEWDAEGRVYQGESVSYSSTIYGSSLLYDAGAPAGYASWEQGGRPVAYETYRASESLYRLPSINIFAVHLFTDVDTLELS